MGASGDKAAGHHELTAALKTCRGAFLGVGLIRGIVNVLMLTGSFFMLQVYDRVLPSGSVPTLVGLAVLVLFLYAVQGILDAIRQRLLARIGSLLDNRLKSRVFDVITGLSLRSSSGDGLQASRDLDQIRSYLSGLGPTAFFDLPWIPLYLGICFIFHPLIGFVATAGAIILVAVTLSTELLSKAHVKTSYEAAARAHAIAETARRNCEALRAMGFGKRIATLWQEASSQHLYAQRHASDVYGDLGATSKVLRMLLQSGILAVGAWLVIRQEATAGIMIASSIMVSRALAPVELAIANWKSLSSARSSWRRLGAVLAQVPAEHNPMPLPRPKSSLVVETLCVAPPGARRLASCDVSLSLAAGEILGIVGANASGKSSLAKTLVGVWSPVSGTVRLDGASLKQWDRACLGDHLGYLPQDIELFSGSIAQNISRFAVNADPAAIIAAAGAAGVHEMIVRLPDGYETRIGDQGSILSAGQMQRLALARALYGDPFLVVLDEPNSNLDAEGEAALLKAIESVRKRGGIAVLITHSRRIVSCVDRLMVMDNGCVQSFGRRKDIYGGVSGPASARPLPIRAVSVGEADIS